MKNIELLLFFKKTTVSMCFPLLNIVYLSFIQNH